MLTFLFTTLLTFFKVLVYSSYTNDQLLIKFMLILCLFIGLILYYKTEKPLDGTANIMISKYKIRDNKDKYKSFIIIFIYIILFIICVLYLRMVNSYNPPNLKEIYYKTTLIMSNSTLFVNIINVTLCIMFIISYIIILISIFKYVKKHIIKFHIYYRENKKYYNTITRFYFNYSVYSVPNYEFLITKGLLGFSFRYHIVTILKILHYIILLIIFVYDFTYNNYILQHTYKILPYIFIYQTYIKISDFYNDVNSMHDQLLYNLAYKEGVLIVKDEILFNGDVLPYSLECVKNVIYIYFKYNLNNWLFYHVIEKITLLRFNYMLDWKLRQKKIKLI